MMLKNMIWMTALFLAALAILMGLAWSVDKVTAQVDPPPCQQGQIDPTTGQPCPPRGGAATGCRQNWNPLSLDFPLLGLTVVGVGLVWMRRRPNR